MKILVFGLTENYGGVESVIFNYYNELCKLGFEFDFLCNTDQKVAYESELTKNGSKVYHTPKRTENFFKYIGEMKKFFQNRASNYDCLWFNTNDLVNIDCIRLAKKYKIKRIIIHSHNSQMMDQGVKGAIKKAIHFYHKNKIINYGTDFWACSKAAGEWLFPNKLNSKIKLIKNAINVRKNSFNLKLRKENLKRYDLEGNFVIGNVGRLSFQKNQQFMLTILKKLVNKSTNIKLVLVGEGEDKRKIIHKARELNVYNNVKLVGAQSDMQSWYSTFDVFLFPSIFEGLSVALLEAQSNGLPIVASDNISQNEIQVNDNLVCLGLDESVDKWVNAILKYRNCRLSQSKIYENFDKSGYDIASAAQHVSQILLKN